MQKSEWKLPKHPSGKPQRKEKRGYDNGSRLPRDGALNQKLHQRELAAAIGFHRFVIQDDD